MTEMEKMRSGDMYMITDPEVQASGRRAKDLCRRLLAMTPYDEEFRRLISELIPGIPSNVTICPPFFCDYGSGIILGDNVFINYNCVFLDSGLITLGDNVLIGPNCQLLTPIHPFDSVERRLPKERALPITIGADSWLGGGVTVCPGVNIGKGCIIGAGSVVTKDIPDFSLAAGNPATVKRHLK